MKNNEKLSKKVLTDYKEGSSSELNYTKFLTELKHLRDFVWDFAADETPRELLNKKGVSEQEIAKMQAEFALDVHRELIPLVWKEVRE